MDSAVGFGGLLALSECAPRILATATCNADQFHTGKRHGYPLRSATAPVDGETFSVDSLGVPFDKEGAYVENHRVDAIVHGEGGFEGDKICPPATGSAPLC